MVELILARLIRIPAILIAVVGHEMSHGYMSYKLGDPTPKYDGRLSINPIRHLDVLGTILLVLFGFGWAKPVVVNPQYYKKPRRDMALVALAGPLSNFIMAIVSYFLFGIFSNIFRSSDSSVVLFISMILQSLVYINLGLMVFNLIPIPPLDGSRILARFLPDKLFFQYAKLEPYGMYIVFALVAVGVGSSAISYLMDITLTGISFVIDPLLNLIF